MNGKQLDVISSGICVFVHVGYIHVSKGSHNTGYTKILEVNLFAFAYRLFHRDFSPINGTFCITLDMYRLLFDFA